MVRTVWIGLICLIVICGLSAYKIGFAAPAKSQAASDQPVAVIANAQYVPATRNAAATQDASSKQASSATQFASAAQDASVSPGAPGSKDAPASKTDRLDVDYLQDVPGKTLVHTIPIVISDPATPASTAEPRKAAPEKATKITSRHWRSSYARLGRRHYRRQREALQPAKDVKPVRTGLLGWLRPAAK